LNFNEYEKTHHALYRDFAGLVESKLKEEILKAEGLPRLQSTQSREKDPVSLKVKLEDRGLLTSDQVETEIKDLAGVRLIFYTNTDVDQFLNSQLITGAYLMLIFRKRGFTTPPTKTSSDPIRLFILLFRYLSSRWLCLNTNVSMGCAAKFRSRLS
jgi:hypothetical protein